MCLGCWEEAGSPKIINETVKQTAKAIDKVYEYHLAGGSLHIAVDDWNLEDSSLDACEEFMNDAQRNSDSSEEQDQAERECLRLLRLLTEDERYSACALHEGFFTEGEVREEER